MQETFPAHDSCVRCFKGDTPTAFGMDGDIDFWAAGLCKAGVPEDQAIAMATMMKKEDWEDSLVLIRLCRECAKTTGMKVGRLPGTVPLYDQEEMGLA